MLKSHLLLLVVSPRIQPTYFRSRVFLMAQLKMMLMINRSNIGGAVQLKSRKRRRAAAYFATCVVPLIRIKLNSCIFNSVDFVLVLKWKPNDSPLFSRP